MRAKLTRIEAVAAGDKTKVWDVLVNVTLVEHLADSATAELTKKLVLSRMAEAEANGKPLDYDTIEKIIENDANTQSTADKPSGGNDKRNGDLALGMFGPGGKKGGGGRGGFGKWSRPYGNGKGGGNGGKWKPRQQLVAAAVAVSKGRLQRRQSRRQGQKWR